MAINVVAEIPVDWKGAPDAVEWQNVPAIEVWHASAIDDIGELTLQGIGDADIPDLLANQATAFCNVGLLSGDVVATTTDPGGPATHTHIITGNVCAEDRPIVAAIYAIDQGTGRCYNTTSDVAGNYSVDVYPDTGPIVLLRAQLYGIQFPANGGLAVGDRVYPSVANGYVFDVVVAGTTAATEPVWSTIANTVSGGVTFQPILLYKPVGGGYVLPVITPI